MRKFLAALCCYLLVASSAFAQVGFGGMFPGPGTPASGGGGSYTGPVDVVTATDTIECWSLRACEASTAGGVVIEVCDAGDADCADFVTDGTTGDLIWQTVGSTDCQATGTCTIRTIYDQMATGCELSQSDESRRFLLKDSIENGHAGALNATSGLTKYYTMTGGCFATQVQPVSMSFVYKRTAPSAGTAVWAFFYTAGQPIFQQSISADALQGDCGGGLSSATATDNTIIAAQLICNGASSFININGSSTSVTSGSSGFTGTTAFQLGGAAGTGSWDGYWFESLAIKVALTNPTSAAALGSNQTTYW